MAAAKRDEPISDPEAAFERFKRAVASLAAAPKAATVDAEAKRRKRRKDQP